MDQVTLDDVLRVVGAVSALGAVIMGLINSHKIKEVHVSINSRMDRMLEITAAASHAEGVEQERKETEDRKNL